MKDKDKGAEGIVRRIEGLGRLVIPKAVREHLGVTDKDRIEFVIGNKDSVILRKYSHVCIFCNSDKDLKEFNDRTICQNCIEEIKKI